MKSSYALITGGSSGIGREIAKLFAKDGYNVIIIGRDKEALKRVKEELETKNVEVMTISEDLSSPGAPNRIHSKVKNKNVEFLINNAGFSKLGKFNELSEKEISSLISVNLTSLTELTHLFLPSMIQKKKGKILNVASTAAFMPGPLMAVYHASKSYVLYLSLALSNELKGTGVSVTCLCPGPTKTEFQERAKLSKDKAFKLMMPADVVAKQGYNGMMKNTEVVIPGFKNKIVPLIVKLLPRSLILSILRRAREG